MEPDGKPTLPLHRGGEEDREHALGAQAALRPTDGGTNQWRALLVHRRGRKGTDEAQRAVLHPAPFARRVLPMLPPAGERRGTPVVHLVLHLLHPLEAFPQGDARDERPPVRQDIDAHRCGASAYGAGECVSGGGGVKNMGVHPIFHAHPYYNFPNYKSITMSSTRIDANDNGGCLDNWYRRKIHPWKPRF